MRKGFCRSLSTLNLFATAAILTPPSAFRNLKWLRGVRYTTPHPNSAGGRNDNGATHNQ